MKYAAQRFLEGAMLSMKESLAWLVFYVGLLGVLLVLRPFLVKVQGPDPWVFALAIAALAVAMVLIDRARNKAAVAMVLLGVEFWCMASTGAVPYSAFDMLAIPGLTWVVAVVLTGAFASFSRKTAFNQDLLPFIGSRWRIGLDMFAAFALMLAAMSFLLFLPDQAAFTKKVGSDVPVKSLPISQEAFANVIGTMTERFPHDVGLLGWKVGCDPKADPKSKVGCIESSWPLLFSFKWRHVVSFLYVLVVLVAVWRWTQWRVDGRNDARATPVSLPQPLRDGPDKDGHEVAKDLSFTFTFAGITFLFGLHAPLLTAIGFHENLVGYVLLFALFLIGGVATWKAALQLATRKGFSFVVGFLAATAPLYAVTAGIGFFLFSSAFETITAEQVYAMTVVLQVAIGVLLVFTSYAILGLAHAATTIKYAAVCSLVFPIAGYWLLWKVSSTESENGVAQSVLLMILAALAVGTPILGERIAIRRRSAAVLHVAASNCLALAPLVIGAQRFEAIQPGRWRNVRLGDNLAVRLFACDSEEEVAYIAKHTSYRSLMAGTQPQVVITDVVTGLALIAETRAKGFFRRQPGFVLAGVLARVPWRMARWPNRDSNPPIQPTLVPGFLGYRPSDELRSRAPFREAHRYEVPTGFGSILSYCLEARAIAAGVLPEPHASRAEADLERAGDVEFLEAPASGEALPGFAAGVPYVVLHRSDVPISARSASWTAFKEALAVGVRKLNGSLHVLDVATAAKIAAVLNDPKAGFDRFEAPVVDRALRRCVFGASADPFVSAPLSPASPLQQGLADCAVKLGLVQKASDLLDASMRPRLPWWKGPLFDEEVAGNGDDRKYYPLLSIWVQNQPNRLREVLEAFADVNLVLVHTASAGAHGLIYLLPKPQHANLAQQLAADKHFEPVSAPPDRAGWAALVKKLKDDLSKKHCIVCTARGVLIRVRDDKKGLLEGLSAVFAKLPQAPPPNLEVVAAFPYEAGAGLALLLFAEEDQQRAVASIFG